jgi:hypothetical protein
MTEYGIQNSEVLSLNSEFRILSSVIFACDSYLQAADWILLLHEITHSLTTHRP